MTETLTAAETPEPARPVVYVDPAGGSSPRVARAFAAGCGGAEIVEDGELRSGPWAGFGSPHTWECMLEARRQGRPWWYVDHAYFGRFEFYRVTANAFQLSCAPAAMQPGVAGIRLARLGVEIQPWQRGGRHVLVCPPDDKIARLMGYCERAWLDQVMAQLRRHTDREIRVRGRELGEGGDRPLSADLAGAWCLVTHTSNAAVEALVAGVPVICTGDCAARPLGLGDVCNVEYPIRPDNRRAWAAMLAANQWTLDEIAAGDCWRQIGQ